MFRLLQKVICKDIVHEIIFEYTDRVVSEKDVRDRYYKVLIQIKFRNVLHEMSLLFAQILLFR